MLSSIGRSNTNALLISILSPAFLIAVLAFSGGPGYWLDLQWVLLLVGGEIALLLMGFPWPEIRRSVARAANRSVEAGDSARSCYFWEAAARNAVNLGVLGTLVGFVTQVCSDTGGLSGFPAAFGRALLSTTYGIVLASIFGMISLKFRLGIPTADTPDPAETWEQAPQSSGFWSHGLGYILFLGLFLWILFSSVPAGPYRPVDWFVHWPAWLVVLGGTIALALLSGSSFIGTALVPGFAFTGILGSFLGIGQALQGFSAAKIQMVAQGITFMISSCFAVLAGLLAVAYPLLDRSRDRRSMLLLRVVWYGFPVLTLLLIATAAVMVMIPIKIENAGP
ncbi:MAG: hypothetical protein H6Q05_1989 [Acidobacteria bacterium]|nr:hypothetical protein [Acidobacteriota bacterium]